MYLGGAGCSPGGEFAWSRMCKNGGRVPARGAVVASFFLLPFLPKLKMCFFFTKGERPGLRTTGRRRRLPLQMTPNADARAGDSTVAVETCLTTFVAPVKSAHRLLPQHPPDHRGSLGGLKTAPNPVGHRRDVYAQRCTRLRGGADAGGRHCPHGCVALTGGAMDARLATAVVAEAGGGGGSGGGGGRGGGARVPHLVPASRQHPAPRLLPNE
jgi:hypothetical protein